VINSAAALDFGDNCPAQFTELRSTLSIPLVHRRTLAGVLTLYSRKNKAYSESHKQLLEGIAPHIGALVHRSQIFRAVAPSLVPGFPSARHLDGYIRQRLPELSLHETLSLLVLRLPNGTLPSLLERTVRAAAQNLRGGDLIFICDETTVACLLSDTTNQSASAAVSRVLSALRSDRSLEVGPVVRSAIVAAPDDGDTLATLLSQAEQRLAPYRVPPTELERRQAIH
jgi:hypothetical protein